MKLISVRESNSEIYFHKGLSLLYHNYDPVPFVILGGDLAYDDEPYGFYCDVFTSSLHASVKSTRNALD